MIHNIHTLAQDIVNQISAGEVVERPANMVKELTENALDAKADKIEIRFNNGGRFVQITDNGQGIQSSDLHLALAPHSTSKIQTTGDLWKINSYGFRGEALASIAEVSDLLIISKPSNQSQAARLKSVFGNAKTVEPTGAASGTTVIVKDLFQNVPARRKFLKSEISETSVIKNTLKAIALSRPDVEFKVFHKDRLLFYWTKKRNLKDRVQEVLSLKDPFDVHVDNGNVFVSAVLCSPNEVAQNRRQMWFFVNNRWVENSTLYSAVLTAYRGLLMHGEYPIAVLHLSCPSEDLDVNVHPAKAQIRFKNQSVIFKAVHGAVRSTLEKAPWLKEEQSLMPISSTTVESRSLSKESVNPTNVSSSSAFRSSRSSGFSSVTTTPKNSNVSGSFTKSTIQQLKPNNIVTDQKTQTSHPTQYWSSLHILSQAHLTYIITQSPTAVVFIDQHAAHERILYEQLMLRWNTGNTDVQHRLIPLTLSMDESMVEDLCKMQNDLLKLGLKIERFSPNKIVIHSAPPILKDVALQKALTCLAEEIKSQGGSFALENTIASVCAQMACHSAIRAGQMLSTQQMKELLRQMDQFPLSSFCPHGRPVSVTYPLSQIEREFGRRV